MRIAVRAHWPPDVAKRLTMIDLRSMAGGIVVAGSLALGIGAGVAEAAPAPVSPEVQSTSQIGEGAGQVPVTPSPYAAYGGDGICATPGLYFVNKCT
ncbi:hypothetical protein TUM20985_48460 [Mycobacterium antarcticum]|nr:hypothetical protein TUM20985_48460 [Mycolicibacterium sp. TUM20985]